MSETVVEQPIILAGDVELEKLCTDTGNARRFAEEYGADCRYCLEEKMWYVWQPAAGQWLKDPQNLLMLYRAKMLFQQLRGGCLISLEELSATIGSFSDKLTKKMEPRANCTLEPHETNALAAYKVSRALLDWYQLSENMDRLNKCIDCLKSEAGMAIHSGLFDADPYLFNCIMARSIYATAVRCANTGVRIFAP
jgi:hypothetical protein